MIRNLCRWRRGALHSPVSGAAGSRESLRLCCRATLSWTRMPRADACWLAILTRGGQRQPKVRIEKANASRPTKEWTRTYRSLMDFVLQLCTLGLKCLTSVRVRIEHASSCICLFVQVRSRILCTSVSWAHCLSFSLHLATASASVSSEPEYCITQAHITIRSSLAVAD